MSTKYAAGSPRLMSPLRYKGIVICAFAILNTVAFGHWAMPDQVPVDRIVANLTRYTEEHPQDPKGFYTLGRIHSFAYERKAPVANIYSGGQAEASEYDGTLPFFDPDRQWSVEDWVKEHPGEVPTTEQLAVHLSESVKAYEQAIQLSDSAPEYHLGLASILESGARDAGSASVLPRRAVTPAATPEATATIESLIALLDSEDVRQWDTARAQLSERIDDAGPLLFNHRQDDNLKLAQECGIVLRVWWREAAIGEYLCAYRLGIKADLAQEEQPFMGSFRDFLSYEAGDSYLKMVRARGPRDAEERKQLEEIDDNLKKLEALPSNGGITPIILSLHSDMTLDELVSPDSCVEFDLDGTGRPQAWPWVKPETAILVWDPDRTGMIATGRQLFGTVTWWMFFENGYGALAALDDDGDGWLSGVELPGLALWFDRNTNGRSDLGEVIPIEDTEVAALSTSATDQAGDTPWNETGLILKDGTLLPTWDWTVHPLDCGQDHGRALAQSFRY